MRSRRLGTIGLLLSLWPSSAPAVSAPQLVADLATTASPAGGSRPHDFVTLGASVVFAAQPDDHADRFFRADGTANGTEELAAPCGPLLQGSIYNLFATSRQAYFSVSCANAEPALWVSDGTASGTVQLLGSGEFHQLTPDVPMPIWAGGEGHVLFLQGSEFVRLELWSTDGTAGGTARLAVLSQGEGATGAVAPRANADFMVLVVDRYAPLRVWRSDGTASGTLEVSVVDFGPEGFALRSLAASAGGIDFAVERGNPIHRQLWRSDGTASGTQLLADFDVQIRAELVGHEGAVYFTAMVAGQMGIWRSDGTAATTRRIADLAGREVAASSFAFLGGRIFYLSFDSARTTGALFAVATDGGEPVEIASVCEQTYCSPEEEDQWLRSVGGSLVYARHQGEISSVWKSDGLAGGSSPLTPSCTPAECYRAGVEPVALQDRLFFSRWTQGAASRELWISDGSVGGTFRLGSPWPVLSWVGWISAAPIAALPDGSGWLFAAGESAHGVELWRARDQADSAVLIADLRLDRPSPVTLEIVGTAGADLLFSLPIEYHTRTLYRHDSGTEGADPLFDLPIHRGSYGSLNPPPALREAGGFWFFFESNFDGDANEFAGQVWRYDPHSGSVDTLFENPATTGVGALAPDLHASGSDYVLLGSRDAQLHPAVYLLRTSTGAVTKLLDLPGDSARSIGRSGEFWFLDDGEGRIVAFDLRHRALEVVSDAAGGPGYQPSAFPMGALFEVDRVSESGDGRMELWQSDGTAAGTSEVAHWPSRADGCVWMRLPQRSGRSPAVFAVRTDCSGATELWITDGSGARTRRLQSLWMEEPLVDDGAISYRGALYFLSVHRDPATLGGEYAIWRTNGTPEGTLRVAALPVSDAGYAASLQGAAGGEGIYFPWIDPDHGEELWRTDGTASGTGLFADLEPGPASSGPRDFRSLGDQVLFAASSSLAGRELWQVDGRSSLPELVADLYPGPESSSPEILAASDEALYFLADDGVVGREIWEVGRPSVAPCVISQSTLCLADRRFRARATWRNFAGETGEAGAMLLTDDDSGYLWFFSPWAPEVVSKVVDACGLAGAENFWVYSTGLTNVEAELEVVDTVSGERHVVRSGLGEVFGPDFDTGSFHTCAAGRSSIAPEAPGLPDPLETPRVPPIEPPPYPILRFSEQRFEVTATWEKPDGTTGDGWAVPVSFENGFFWFFSPSNVELEVKLIDNCGVPAIHNFWLFVGGLTDLAVHLTVRDTWSGEVATYDNPQGHPFTPLLETGRFRVCDAVP